MSKLESIYNSFIGKHILTAEENQNYKDNTLTNFLNSKDKYLIYDNLSNNVLMLSEAEMKIHYNNGNYRDRYNLVESLSDFCLLCCIEVLKEFSDYSIEEIKEEFIKHDLLKSYVI